MKRTLKKRATFFLTLSLLLTVLLSPATKAQAAEKDFLADYFPTGKLQAPEAPYLKETQFEGQSTQLAIFHYQTPQLQKLAMDIQQQDSFYESYGLSQLDLFLQIDVKFNDGEWISQRGRWDELNEDQNIFYGDNIIDWNLTFLHREGKAADEASKLLSSTQSWLVYFDPENPVNDYLKPFITTSKDEYDGNVYTFDFNEVTISYRIRWCVQCLIDEYTENEKWTYLLSDWSPETSIGKNGTQEEVRMPDKLEAPVLSDFQLFANEDGTGAIKYFASMPDSIYEAERYQMIINDRFGSYYLEAQVKVNDSDWQDCYVSNATWMQNGERDVDGSGLNLKVTDNAWVRVRVVDTQDENEVSEWSNIIGTQALKGDNEEKQEDGKLPGEPSAPDTTEKAKCKLCGICPIQPLGICLFVWIAVILLVVLVIVIVVVISRKKDEKDKKR